MCKISDTYVRRDSFMYNDRFVTRRQHLLVRGSFVCTIRIIHTCEDSDLCVRHDSFICNMCFVTFRQHLLDRGSSVHTVRFVCICATFLIYVCDVTHSFVVHDLQSAILKTPELLTSYTYICI